MRLIITTLAALCFVWDAALAKSAYCFTTDDGEYVCEFVATDVDGSFEISAPNRPSYSLFMAEPGVAAGFADFGDGNVVLPGRFLRSRSDPGCWVNDATGVKICAW